MHPPRHRTEETGSIAVLALGILLGAVGLIAILGAVGASYVTHAELQQAADIAAAAIEGGGDAPLERARALATANGATRVDATLVEAGTVVRIRVRRRAPAVFGMVGRSWIHAEAQAKLPIWSGDGGPNPAGEYSGPLEVVDSARVCPVVARAWRAMETSAARDGITLTATSGFRTYAEQAILFAQLGPRLAAPPGSSRHHDATELDVAVGPAGSPTHDWLRAHGPARGFIQRYSCVSFLLPVRASSGAV